MKKIILVFCAVLFLGATSTAFAQSYRVTNLADQLQRQADDLAERLYENYSRSYGSNRTELENLFLAQQLKASADIFGRMIRDRKRESDLRDAAAILSDITRRAPTYGSNSSQWREVQRSVNDISRELGGNGGGSGNEDDDNGIVGRIRWKGTVDDEIQLVIQAKGLDVRTISGQDYGAGSTTFTTFLPERKVKLEIRKKKGRGDVKVIQNPSRDNNYKAIIQIRDRDGGAKEYDIEIVWR